MAVKTKDELKTDLDGTLIDGGLYTAAEGRAYNTDFVDSLDNFKTTQGASKGTMKGQGNTDLSADETGDMRQIVVNGLIMQQTYVGAAWTTTQIVIPYGVKLLFKANGNSDLVTPETGDTYMSVDAEGTLEQIVQE